MKAKTLTVLITACAAMPAFAGDLDLSLTNHSARAQVNAMDSRAPIDFGAGYTYHTGSRNIFNLDFHAQGRTALGNLPATAGLGVRGIYFNDNGTKGGGVGIGGFTTVNIPQVPGLSVGGSLHYAPNVLSFDAANHIWDFDGRVSYRVIRNGEVYAGYRYLSYEPEHGDNRVLDNGLMAGMKLYF